MVLVPFRGSPRRGGWSRSDAKVRVAMDTKNAAVLINRCQKRHIFGKNAPKRHIFGTKNIKTRVHELSQSSPRSLPEVSQKSPRALPELSQSPPRALPEKFSAEKFSIFFSLGQKRLNPIFDWKMGFGRKQLPSNSPKTLSVMVPLRTRFLGRFFEGAGGKKKCACCFFCAVVALLGALFGKLVEELWELVDTRFDIFCTKNVAFWCVFTKNVAFWCVFTKNVAFLAFFYQKCLLTDRKNAPRRFKQHPHVRQGHTRL